MNSNTNVSNFINVVSTKSFTFDDSKTRNIATRFAIECFLEYEKELFNEENGGSVVTHTNTSTQSDEDNHSQNQEITDLNQTAKFQSNSIQPLSLSKPINTEQKVVFLRKTDDSLSSRRKEVNHKKQDVIEKQVVTEKHEVKPSEYNENYWVKRAQSLFGSTYQIGEMEVDAIQKNVNEDFNGNFVKFLSSKIRTEQSSDDTKDEVLSVSSDGAVYMGDIFTIHTLSDEQYGTGLIDAEQIDQVLTELIEKRQTPCVSFVTDETDGDAIKKYFRENFPISEYRCLYAPATGYESNKTYVRIIYNGLESVSAMKQRIDKSLVDRDYFDIWTTFSEESFRNRIISIISSSAKIFFCKSYEINSRLTSFRFWKWNEKEFVLPSKEEVNAQFELYDGDKTPTIFYQNVPVAIFNKLKGFIYGNSLIKTKKQPSNAEFVNILVFKNNKSS